MPPLVRWQPSKINFLPGCSFKAAARGQQEDVVELRALLYERRERLTANDLLGIKVTGAILDL